MNNNNNKNNNIPNAQLWIGAAEQLEQQAIAYLQKIWCPQYGCNTCIICKQIHERQYHLLMWLTPEKQYTLEQLDQLFEKIAFKNNLDAHFFIVLEHAQLLTGACANKLLKSLEEPPPGYHFLLLTNQAQAIIPTIRSRCTITHQESTHIIFAHPLLNFFKEHKLDSIQFMQTLETSTPNENESIELIEQILGYWYEKALKNPTQTNDTYIKILQTALTQPPMPGSNKIFWRNLFMQWHTH